MEPEKDPDEQEPDTENLHKWSNRTLTRSGPTRSWILIRAVQKILLQRSCTRILIQVVQRMHKTPLLEARVSSFRGYLAEFARLQDPDASGPKASQHRDPETEILQRS